MEDLNPIAARKVNLEPSNEGIWVRPCTKGDEEVYLEGLPGEKFTARFLDNPVTWFGPKYGDLVVCMVSPVKDHRPVAQLEDNPQAQYNQIQERRVLKTLLGQGVVESEESDISTLVRLLDTWCLENCDCNLSAWMGADSRDVRLENMFLDYIYDILKMRRRGAREN